MKTGLDVVLAQLQQKKLLTWIGLFYSQYRKAMSTKAVHASQKENTKAPFSILQMQYNNQMNLRHLNNRYIWTKDSGLPKI